MVAVLDCTFRDGGYYNDWDFTKEFADLYFESVSRLPIDMVEVGYCNYPKNGYYGKFFFLTKNMLEPIRLKLREAQMLGVMLNAKDIPVESVKGLLSELVGTVDIVRLAVAPKDLAYGAALARRIHEMGFRVGFNIMYLSDYWNNVESVLAPLYEEQSSIDSFALVDSYGSCTPEQVSVGIKNATVFFNGPVAGFHGHDNLGLAFANTLAAINAGAEIVDGTFVGMGRGAGNLRTELILIHESNKRGVSLDYDALADVVSALERLREQYRWGTNLAYMISGAAGLPQRDVMDWIGKNRYSTATILRALQQVKSGTVDEEQHPLLSYKSLELDVSPEILIVGGGPSVGEHLESISQFVVSRNLPVIHANIRNLNTVGSFGQKQIIGLAGHGAARIPSNLDLSKVQAFVVPTPPRLQGMLPEKLPRPVLQTKPFTVRSETERLGPVSDIGPLALALGAAAAIGAKRISLVGFDGYTAATSAQQDLAREVQNLLDGFAHERPEVQIESLTPTLYEVPRASIYSRLAESVR